MENMTDKERCNALYILFGKTVGYATKNWMGDLTYFKTLSGAMYQARMARRAGDPMGAIYNLETGKLETQTVTPEMVETAKRIAQNNYNTWGDLVVECMEDDEIAEELAEFPTFLEWIKEKKKQAKLFNEQQQSIDNQMKGW